VVYGSVATFSRLNDSIAPVFADEDRYVLSVVVFVIEDVAGCYNDPRGNQDFSSAGFAASVQCGDDLGDSYIIIRKRTWIGWCGVIYTTQVAAGCHRFSID
jgi:hypothetical protein